jgi:acetylornithine deacetylase/succinyl-diaminopimelate desuccinylase-like protein
MNLTSSVNDLLNSVLTDALKNGNEALFKELKDRLNGQQSRIDSVLQTQVQSTQQASADHSLLEQLFKNHKDLVQVINTNSSTERNLINQLGNVHINGGSLLHAIEEECNATINHRINKVITKKTIQYIDRVENEIDEKRIEVKKSNEKMISTVEEFQKHILFFFVIVVLIVSLSWWWMKLLLGILGIVGGIYLEQK